MRNGPTAGGPILCVDDEPINLGILRQVLKDSHPLVFARNGTEALVAVAKHRPSLVLLDVQMPEMNGYEVCRRLKRNPLTENVRVIFVTSRSDEPDETAGFDAGGVDYVTKPISAPILRARVGLHLSLVRAEILENSHRAAVYMLGEAGHYNDAETGVHIWRMAAYTRALAEALGWDDESCGLIELAAAMHDTGKIGIPDAILKKPDTLDAEEWEIMKTHTRIGHDILVKGEVPLFQLAAEIALHHHERWDGTGYPQRLAGEYIPEPARIAAVADVFDALSMKRPYKEAWPLEQVLATIKESAGSHLDPQMVARFLDLRPRILEIKAHWDAREEIRVQEASITGLAQITGSNITTNGNQTNAAAVFDPATYRELFGNDEAEGRQWLAAYIVSATQLLVGVERNAAGGDRRALAANAHKLASESLAVGAMRLGTLVRKLEAGVPEAPENELRRLVEAVTAASRGAQEAITRYISTSESAA
jgi:putative two-component system response regulator